MKPACSYYRKCSGCTLLQFPYEKQLHDKTLLVREKLGRFAAGRAIDKVCEEIVPSPLPLGYRSSTKLCLSMDTFGRKSIGLYERQSKTVVDIPQCPVHHEAINRLVRKMFGPSAPGKNHDIPFYNHAKRGFQEACLKFVTVRHCPSTGAFGVVISHTGVDDETLRAWLTSLRMDNVSVFGSALTRADEDRVLGHQTTHLSGPETFVYEVSGLRFTLTPEAFFQANFSLTDRFVAKVTEPFMGRQTGGKAGVLLDLYGGFGAYALSAAKAFDQLVLVDANGHAIESARVTARQIGATNLQAVHASSEDYLARLSKTDAKAITHLIVNPPRSGLSPKVKERLDRENFPAAEELVYVSCDLATLSRDLNDLVLGQGWRVESVSPFDMFPQTDHVEIVARLKPGSKTRNKKPPIPVRVPQGKGRSPVKAAPKKPGRRPKSSGKARS